MKKILAVLFSFVAIAFFAGCESNADVASRNLSTAAENFEVQRLIVGVNAISDKPAFLVEGRCSIEPNPDQVVVICKHAENDLRKHYLGLADNVYWTSTQLEAMDVSEYRTRIILKPTSVVPNFDLQVK